MKPRKRITLAIVAVGCAFGLAACSKKTPEQRSAHMQKKIQRKLDLNETQSAKLKELADAMVAARTKMRSDRADMYNKTEALLASEQISQNDIMSLVKPKMQQFEKEVPTIADKLANFHNTLNKEQKDKLVKFVAKVRKHHMEH